MKTRLCKITLLLCLGHCTAVNAIATAEPPSEWIDADTGHRIIRLSRDAGTASLYFHQNAFTAKGDKLVMVTPDGISTVNFKTREIDLVVPGVARSTNISHGIIVGKTKRQLHT